MESMYPKYFVPLCEKLGLVVESNCNIGLGFVSAVGGFVRVFFESDRGLCNLSVGSAVDDGPLCSVDEFAGRFPRIRSMPGGLQRLTLEEQSQLLSKYWDDIQIMFSPEHISETKKWSKSAADASMEKWSGNS